MLSIYENRNYRPYFMHEGLERQALVVEGRCLFLDAWTIAVIISWVISMSTGHDQGGRLATHNLTMKINTKASAQYLSFFDILI